jgi:photosystem II stability/assembly factor-like uncharacterized protein/predicted esterase
MRSFPLAVLSLFVQIAACGQRPPAASSDAPAMPDANICAGQPGELHAQPLESGGVLRHYFLYVPAAYDCGSAWPLLVDFHGTAEGSEGDDPEEYYALPGMMAAADAERFIVARPRSTYEVVSGDENLYQWDIEPGDLAENVTFAHDLTAYLQANYHIDPARTYAAGFSNGTNMASQFMADEPMVFHGFAVIGGGVWDMPATTNFGNPPERVYAMTGYREYLYPYRTALLDFLAQAGLPSSQIWERKTDSGHEIYGWHYSELFPWLDQGIQPPAGALGSGWTSAQGITGGDDLLEIATAPDGARVVSANNGDLWRQATAGASWTHVGHITGVDASSETTAAPNLAGLCIDPNGNGVAVGNGIVGRSTDGGATWSNAAGIPSFGPFDFLTSEFFGLGCSGSAMSGGGYTAIGYSTDGGSSWHAGSALEDGFPGQLNTMAVGPTGTWIAGGYYDYLGRSTDGGVTFTEVDPQLDYQWFNGLAAQPGGLWWVVGEAGSIFASTDDGQTWTQQTSPNSNDFYAVAFANPQQGLAVGVHGAAVYTADGGATWTDVSTGLDIYLGDVAWDADGTTATVVGENGAVLAFAPPSGTAAAASRGRPTTRVERRREHPMRSVTTGSRQRARPSRRST